MKTLLSVIVLVLLAVAFFVAWPGWTAYQIYTAILAKDAPALEGRIDFPGVRTSLRAATTDKVAALYVPPSTLPSSPVLAERLKQEAIARVVAGALENLVTAENLLLVISEGGPLKGSIERMLRDQMSRGAQVAVRTGPGSAAPVPGTAAGKRGPVVRTVTSDPLPPPSVPGAAVGKRGPVVRTVTSDETASEPVEPKGYRLGNVKGLRILGPFRYEIGVAKDAASPVADVAVELGFTGLDWKIVAVRPHS